MGVKKSRTNPREVGNTEVEVVWDENGRRKTDYSYEIEPKPGLIDKLLGKKNAKPDSSKATSKKR